MGVYLSQLRVYPEKEFSMLRNRTFTPVLIELTYKRQLVLILLDFGLIAFASLFPMLTVMLYGTYVEYERNKIMKKEEE